jgi:flagellar basal-body rod protein FlgG
MISAVSLQALQRKLDIIANNVANSDTPGYKKKDASFIDILTSMRPQEPSFIRGGRLTPGGYTFGAGSRMGLIQTDLSQGTLKSTGNELDMALQGDAVFEVEVHSVDANGNQVIDPAWTRDGAFLLSLSTTDPGNMYLTTKGGNYVRDGVTNQPIRVPVNESIRVDRDGVVTGYDKTDPADPGNVVGRLKVLRVIRPEAMEHTGNNLYRLSAGYNINNVLQVVDPNVAADSLSQINVRQGFLEQSNVDMEKVVSDMLVAQRAFQLNARAIQSSDSLMNMANNLRG